MLIILVISVSNVKNSLIGWTGARLAQLLQEAALVAVRKGHKAILQPDLDEAVDRLTIGPKRVAIELGYQGQCHRATTEVGTALISHLLRQLENANVESCDRISINPRGQVSFAAIFITLSIFFPQPEIYFLPICYLADLKMGHTSPCWLGPLELNCHDINIVWKSQGSFDCRCGPAIKIILLYFIP